jgi:tetratricopeptide (TPR) repeat protein
MLLRHTSGFFIGLCLAAGFALPAAVQAGSASAGPNDAKITAASNEAKQAFLKGDLPAAEQKYLEALQLIGNAPNITHVVILSNLGAVYRDESKYQEAEDTFKSAIAMSDQVSASASMRSNLMQQYAVLLRKTHRHDEAEKVDKQAKALVQTPLPAGFPPGAGRPVQPGFGQALGTGGLMGFITGADQPTAVTLEQLKAMIAADPHNGKLWLSLATYYLKTRDYENAMPAYKNVVMTSADCAAVHAGLAACYLKNNKYPEAAEECRVAYNKDRNNAILCALCCAVYRKAQNPSLAKQYEDELSERFPDDERARHIAQTDTPTFNIFSAPPPTSNPNAPPKAPGSDPWDHKWSRALMPLRVYIPQRTTDLTMMTGAISNVSENSASTLVMQAFDAWAQASGGTVQFRYVEDSAQADIRCQWTSDASSMHSPLAVGETTWARGTVGRPPGHVVSLLAVDARTGKMFSKDRFYEVSLHEIGHALGLSHSDNRDDVMFPVVHPTPMTDLSSGDRQRIMQLYNNQ